MPFTQGRPLFEGLEEQVRELRRRAEEGARAAGSDSRFADLSCYWIYTAPTAAARADALRMAQRDPLIGAAYAPSIAPPPPGDIAPTTPELSRLQFHLLPAPTGIGAVDAQQVLGADGRGRRFADVEWSWSRSHEDIAFLRRAPVLVAPAAALFGDHGTAAIGLIAADPDAVGVRGIAPSAEFALVSANASTGYSVARALVAAQSYLRSGDVLLLQVQARSPLGLVPVEYERAEFDAIRMLSAAGIVVIEPAGNGGVDLDDPFFAGIFDRNQRDSGAIVVAASDGLPPQRTNASSYGSRIDVNAFGLGVTTTGFGDLFDPLGTPEQRYTQNFGGTSAAAAQTAGVALQVLGAADAGEVPFGASLPTPRELRDLLRRTGVAPANARELLQIGTRIDALAALRASGLLRGLRIHGTAGFGSQMTIELQPRDLGFPADAWALWGALQTTALQLPTSRARCGQWQLDPANLIPLGAGVPPAGSNPILRFAIPADPNLRGLRIVMQALFWSATFQDLCLSHAGVIDIHG